MYLYYFEMYKKLFQVEENKLKIQQKRRKVTSDVKIIPFLNQATSSRPWFFDFLSLVFLAKSGLLGSSWQPNLRRKFS